MWLTNKLAEVSTFISRGISPKYIEKGGIRVLNQKCIRNHVINYDLARRHNFKLKKFSEDRFIKKGDVLINSTGQGTLGRVAQVREEPREPTTIDSHITIVRPKQELFYLEYFGYAAIAIEEIIKNSGQGASGQTELAKSKVQNELEISFPISLEEQKNIVAKLDFAFAKIDKSVEENLKNSMNAKLLFESSRAALLSSLDNNYTERTLGSCCERVSVGHVGATSEYYCREDEGVAFLRSQNVKPGKLELGGVQYITKDFHQKIKKSQLQPNDILVVRVGANRGDCCLVPNGIKELNCANIVFARPTEGYAPFLAHFCQSKEGQEKLMGMSTGAAQSVINTKSVATLKIPFPSIEKQKSIAERLDNLCQHCSDLASLYREKSEQLISLKSAILVKELRSDSL